MSTQQAPPTGPGYRELYLLVVGVIVGVLLGPGVFGHFNPAAYDEWFIGSGKTEPLIREAQEKYEADIKSMTEAKITPVAIEEIRIEFERRMAVLKAQRQAKRDQAALALGGRANALLFAMVAMMILETLASADQAQLRSRLAIARYSLMAVWIALVMAQPGLILHTSVAFAGLVLLVAVLGAVIPMPRFGKAKAG